jgi:hypothetical protein
MRKLALQAGSQDALFLLARTESYRNVLNMSTILAWNSNYNTLLSLAKSRLAEKAEWEKTMTMFPNSFEAEVMAAYLNKEAKRDEVQLQKLAQRKEAIQLNESEINRLGLGNNKQMVLKRDKIIISRIDSGEVLFEASRTGSKLLLKLPSLQEAIAQLECRGLVKQVTGVPVVVIKKEKLYSAIRKAVNNYLLQQEPAKKEYEKEVLAGKEIAEQTLIRRQQSNRASLQSDMG